MTQLPSDSIRSLWQSMPTTPMLISPAEMRARAQKFQSRIRLRNFIEYGAFIFILLSFGSFAIAATTWQGKAVNILMILCASVSIWNLHRRGKAVATPADASASALIEFQRAEFSRQRDVMLTAWRWYLLPFVPGFAVFLVVAWMGLLGNGVPLERIRHNVWPVAAAFAALCIVGFLLQLLNAAHLQRRIDDLDRYRENP